MNLLRLIWNDRKERCLLFWCLAFFGTLCLIEVQFPLLESISTDWPWVARFLVASGTKTIVESLLTGLISAYIFYVVIDLVPRERAKFQTIAALNLIIASVLDVYENPGPFRHEAEIHTADINLVNSNWIDEQLAIVKNCSLIPNQASYCLRVKWTAERAHSRVLDFRHVLPLAVSLSPVHATRWLDLTDKIQLLANMYGQQPHFELTDIKPWHDLSVESGGPYAMHVSSVSFRIQEFFEHVKKWIELTRP